MEIPREYALNQSIERGELKFYSRHRESERRDV